MKSFFNLQNRCTTFISLFKGPSCKKYTLGMKFSLGSNSLGVKIWTILPFIHVLSSVLTTTSTASTVATTTKKTSSSSEVAVIKHSKSSGKLERKVSFSEADPIKIGCIAADATKRWVELLNGMAGAVSGTFKESLFFFYSEIYSFIYSRGKKDKDLYNIITMEMGSLWQSKTYL